MLSFRKATNLGLYQDLLFTPKSSPAARNRFIYYPDRLVQLPGPSSRKLTFTQKIEQLVGQLQEPLFKGLFPGVLKDLITPARHPSEWAKDESVADFVERRWGSDIGENVVSSVLHGIYAGDIDQLSAQTLMGDFRNNEGGVGGTGGFVSGGVISSLMSRSMSKLTSRKVDDFMAVEAISAGPELVRRQPQLERLLGRASTFSFKKGVGQLVEALATSLTASPKVKIHKNTEVQSLGRTLHSSSVSVCPTTYD